MQGLDRFQSGAVEVICLTDGDTVFAPEVFAGLPAETRAARLTAAGLDVTASQFNAYVLRHAGGIDLVDTGCGSLMGEKAGRMAALLAALDIAPDDVSRVIYTHLHGDHVGGSLSDGALVYPDAEVLLHRAEAVHWQGSDGMGARMLAQSQRITLLEDGADLGHGMTLWHLPGHTPGHCGLRMGPLALVADIVHSEALQLPDPALSSSYDSDPALAAQTRRAALETVAREDLIWSGSHMLGPQKFARLEQAGEGFRRIAP
ncbi:MBL fold metallo-hydrolase [Sagittula salina]|uniref:MBL fold metallo-hydrolase n=1 Tax=Sagittula salina TaxID=2820268 RepID=A0A940S1D9_9RHOB|nr:MBL fold metallo-hydrolase [Sagittula salina]MBP0482957.1 MBL fold metallo-hydrolase [Sagittula salina]